MGGPTKSAGTKYGDSTSNTGSDVPKSDSGSSGGSGGSSEGSGSGGAIQKTLSNTSTSTKRPNRSPSERQVENAHKNFAESTSVENYEIRKVAEGKQEIESLLEKHFEIEGNHMFGSLTRGTIVGPLDENSDADIMYVLDKDKHKKWIEESDGAEECLDAFKEALEDKILNAESVKIDRNVVTVQFSDYKIEVAPSFNHPQGGYMIPDLDADSRQWIRTAPRMYKEMFESVDRKHGGDLKKMVRNVKTWADNNNVPTRSYHLEAIAFQHMKSFPSDVHIDIATEDFFANLPQYLRSSFKDPAIQEEHLDEYLDDGDRRHALEKAQEAREKMMDAREMKENGDGNSAVEKLDELFGGSE